MTVAGKVVVITGGSRGIGRAVAAECVRAGAHVVTCGRDPAALDEFAGSVTGGAGEQDRAHSGSFLGICADVSRYEDVERLRDGALEAHGRIDAWFNNAGVSLGYRPFDEQSPGELERAVAINLTGHVFGCRAILPYLRDHGGYLLNMVGRGYKGEATPHTAVYAATKCAIASLTRSLAEENRAIPNLSVNAVVPGMVATDFYRDIDISPRLESTRDNWRYALDAFGVPIGKVASETTRLLGDTPGRRSGRIYSLLTPTKTASGIAKMAWWGMTGKLGKG